MLRICYVSLRNVVLWIAISEPHGRKLKRSSTMLYFLYTQLQVPLPDGSLRLYPFRKTKLS